MTTPLGPIFSLASCTYRLPRVPFIIEPVLSTRIQGCGNSEPIARYFGLFSTPLSYSTPDIHCIQLSLNSPDIHLFYRTMSCMIGCFHATACIPFPTSPYLSNSSLPFYSLSFLLFLPGGLTPFFPSSLLYLFPPLSPSITLSPPHLTVGSWCIFFPSILC